MPLIKKSAVVGAITTITSPVTARFDVPGRGTFKGKSVDVKYNNPGVRIITISPGDDVELTIVAAGTPTPPVTPPPITPPVTPPPVHTGGSDVEIKPGDPVNATLTKAGSGTAAKPKTIGFQPGEYKTALSIKLNHVRLIALGGPVVFKGSATYGLDALFKGAGPQNVVFDGLTLSGFGFGVRVQDEVAAATAARDIVFRNMRIVNLTGSGAKDGHGIYCKLVDGLTIEECFIDGAGLAGHIRDMWVHGVYSKETNKRVVMRRNFANDAENFGLQARNSTHLWNDADDGDPGPVFEDNVIYNACNGICIDGKRGRVTGNIVGVRNFLLGTRKNGWSAVYASVGQLTQGNNIRFRAAGPVNRPDGFQDSAWRNAKRTDDDWCWRGACNTIHTTPDIDAIGTTIDLSDHVTRLRANEAIGVVVDEAQARVRAGAAS